MIYTGNHGNRMGRFMESWILDWPMLESGKIHPQVAHKIIEVNVA
jgi:hypothetical protein